MLDTLKLYEYVSKQWQQTILPSLSEYIKIPNKSPHFDANWQEHGYMEQAVNHIASWCRANAPKGMRLDILRLPGRTPLLLVEISGNREQTVLLYGHLDKQPEMMGWREGLGPWQPVEENGRLYGRGAADDGYAVYAALTAISALQQQGIPHGRCLVIIEACEESGSYDLPHYIEHLQERLAEPSLVICLDSGAGNYEQLWMTTSLRGNVVGELTVELLSEGVHSGNASGIVADSFRVAKHLISRLEDEISGDIKVADLHCAIPEQRLVEANACAKVLGEQIYQSFPLHCGVEPVSQNKQQLILNRTWRPALTVTGAEGLPAIVDAGNVLRPRTVLKLSMRIPPLVCPKAAAQIIHNALTERPPYHAKVDFQIEDSAPGWEAPVLSPWLEKAIAEASMAFYHQPPVYMGEGGTIPFMGMLGEKFSRAQFMITGVLGPHANAHGPNEFLHVEMVKKLTSCVSYVLAQHFQNFSPK